MTETMIERVARAIENAEVGWSITLTSLVDGVATYTAKVDGYEAREFTDYHDDAREWVQSITRLHKARAAIEAMREPTVAMKLASFDASGDAEAEAWPAMIQAALEEPR